VRHLVLDRRRPDALLRRVNDRQAPPRALAVVLEPVERSGSHLAKQPNRDIAGHRADEALVRGPNLGRQDLTERLRLWRFGVDHQPDDAEARVLTVRRERLLDQGGAVGRDRVVGLVWSGVGRRGGDTQIEVYEGAASPRVSGGAADGSLASRQSTRNESSRFTRAVAHRMNWSRVKLSWISCPPAATIARASAMNGRMPRTSRHRARVSRKRATSSSSSACRRSASARRNCH
jgi:hypothetical protein